MKKLGLFGGCFNPPLITHINIIKKLIKDKQLYKVIFIPVGDFYQKDNLENQKYRYKMLKKAIKNEKKMEIDNIELKQKNKLYAVDAFKLLSKKYAKYEIYYIMGSDNFIKMNKWKDYDQLKQYKYLILERENNNYKSSSQIREMIKKKIDVSEYLNKEVYKYIKKHKLYI